MKNENYLKIAHQLKMYNEGYKLFSKNRMSIEHTENKVKIGGELVDINKIIMTEFHGNRFPITPYLLASFEYDYAHLKLYYSEYGSKAERLFFKETIGKSSTIDNDYFDVGDYGLQFVKDLSKIESRYKILNTVIVPNGGKTRLESLMAICSKYYLIDHQINLVTVMLNSFLTIFRTLNYNNQKIFETYFKISEFEEYRNKLDVSFDDTITICQALVLDWAINVFRTYLKSTQLSEIEHIMNDFNKEDLLKCAFKRGSKFKKYLEGKIAVQELIDSRNKFYKTRKSDYACESLALWTEETNIKEFTGFFSDDLADILSIRIGDTGGRKAISHLLCTKTWLKSQFELACDHEELENTIDKLEKDVKDAEKRSNSLDRALKKRETKISVLEEKIKQLNTDYKDSVRKNEYESLVEELKELKSSLKDKDKEVSGLQKELTDKTRQFSDSTKLSKKYKAQLDRYMELFGELSEEESVDPSVEALSLPEKVSALVDLDIVILGGSIGMDNYFDKLGLKIFQVLDVNDTTLKKKFDILVVITDMLSHQMVYKAKKQANAIGAMCLYVQGTNKEKIIDLLYSNLMIESS